MLDQNQNLHSLLQSSQTLRDLVSSYLFNVTLDHSLAQVILVFFQPGHIFCFRVLALAFTFASPRHFHCCFLLVIQLSGSQEGPFLFPFSMFPTPNPVPLSQHHFLFYFKISLAKNFVFLSVFCCLLVWGSIYCSRTLASSCLLLYLVEPQMGKINAQ